MNNGRPPGPTGSAPEQAPVRGSSETTAILGAVQRQAAGPLPGNHRFVAVGPVTIGCMDPQARDLLETAERGFRLFTKRRGRRETSREFIRWLFGSSKLVQADQRIAVTEYRKHLVKLREGFAHHPESKFRNWRGSIHGFAHWFFRWSGLVDSSGKGILPVKKEESACR